MYKRIDHDIGKEKKDVQGADYVFQTLVTQTNNKHAHSNTQMAPFEAQKPDNRIDVKLNLELTARKLGRIQNKKKQETKLKLVGKEYLVERKESNCLVIISMR